MATSRHADVLAETAERVALLNEFRTDDFQDAVVRLVTAAREHWRDAGELPPPGTDALYDALMGMAEASDSALVTVRDACAEALRQAEDARVSR